MRGFLDNGAISFCAGYKKMPTIVRQILILISRTSYRVVGLVTRVYSYSIFLCFMKACFQFCLLVSHFQPTFINTLYIDLRIRVLVQYISKLF